jgi:hypothetical protein
VSRYNLPSSNSRMIPCGACGEQHDSATETLLHLGEPYCIECWRELVHGVIPPAYGPIVDDAPLPEDEWQDVDDDDDLAEDGRTDNAVKAMEDTNY